MPEYNHLVKQNDINDYFMTSIIVLIEKAIEFCL